MSSAANLASIISRLVKIIKYCLLSRNSIVDAIKSLETRIVTLKLNLVEVTKTYRNNSAGVDNFDAGNHKWLSY